MMNRFVLAAAFVSLALAGGLFAQQKIAFTWDDLPAHSSLPPGETRQQVIESLIATIKQERLPAPYGFVNSKVIDEQPDLIRVLDTWRAAGFPLGNHAWSHMNLNAPSTSLGMWENDVLQNEAVLAKEMGGQDYHWLRFPYLSEGDTPEKKVGARRFLLDHGYKVAGVTMSFADYAYNEPYTRCMVTGDAYSVKKLEDSYLQEALRNLDYEHRISTSLYGRDIPYILLMHVGAFDAKMLPRLIELYRQHGVTFTTLQDASNDAFYRNDLNLSLGAAPDSLEEAMSLKGLPLPKHEALAIDLSTLCTQQHAQAAKP